MKLFLFLFLSLFLTSCYKVYDTRAKIGISIAEDCLGEGYAIFKNGLLDSEDEPALVCRDQGVFWFRKGLLHRLDGPAVILEEDVQEYWINGVQYSEREFKKFMNKIYSYRKGK